MPLTVLDCNKAIAETGSGIRKVADGHGLYLFVKNGKASWTWQFRTDSGWSSKGFGRFPDVTPKAARDAVGDYKAALRNGTAMVPVRMPRQPRAEFTGYAFKDAVQGWVKWKSADWKGGSRTLAQVQARLNRLPFKTLGEIDTDAVLAAFGVVGGAFTNSEWTHRQANDCRLDLLGVLDWASDNKYMTFGPEGNPANFETRKSRWPKALKRKDQTHMVGLPWAELPDFYKSIPDTDVGRALRFLILTGSRTNELRLATWSEIEPDNGKGFGWSIPAEHTKKERAKFVPMVPEAMALLGERGAPTERLFPLYENSLRDLKNKVRADVDVHGFRNTLADWAGDQDPPYPTELRQIALGHDVGDTVFQAYNRGDRRHLRRGMMEAYAKFATQPLGSATTAR